MPQAAKKVQDRITRQIFGALRQAFPDIPSEQAKVIYRYNPVAIRVKIVSSQFVGKTTAEREAMVNAAFESLPPDSTEDISMQFMLTPREAKQTFRMLSQEFDDPTDTYL